MPRRNEFDTSTATTVAPTGLAAAVFSGAIAGFTHSAKATQKAIDVLSRNSVQRDSLLKSLKALFDDDFKFDNSVLDTFPEELREGLVGTNDAIALTIKNVLLGLSSGVTHTSQLPFDTATIVKHTAENASYTEEHTSKIIPAAISAASTFDLKNEANSQNSSASIACVSDGYGRRIDKVTKAINESIGVPDNSHAQSHQNLATVVAGGSLTVSAAPTAASAVVTDAIGHVSQEVSAVRHFSVEESSGQNQKNVYVATNGVSQATKASDSLVSRDKSRDLEVALSHMKPAADLSSNQSMASPLTSAFVRLVALSLFVESSRSVNYNGSRPLCRCRSHQ